MQLAYVIVAHKGPAQVARLVRALDAPGNHIYLHLDAKADLHDFSGHLTQSFSSEVKFVTPRVKVTWGGYGVVQGVVNAMKAIRGSGIEFHHVLLVSGQCYPIKSESRIRTVLRRHAGRQIIPAASLEDEWTSALPRVRRYHYYDRDGYLTRQALRLANRLLPERRFVRGLKPYGGSMHFAMTMECMDFLLTRVCETPAYRRFFRMTVVPEEFIFHTLIMNSEFASTVFNWNPWFIRWEGNASHPLLLGQADFPDLKASDCLFARKFDVSHDSRILDLIDIHLRKRPPASESAT